MSKESRRRQRTAGQAAGSRPASTERPSGASDPSSISRPATGARASERAGRRARSRPLARGSLIERYRRWLVAAAVVGVIAIVGAGVFAAATQPAYACSTIWQPSSTPTPSEDASPELGFVQPDMGNTHVAVRTSVRYTYCPPASGRHFNAQGAGPIDARVYGPTDAVIPQGWVHNLEHGGLVVLYRDADADQAALRALYDAIPASPVCGFEPGGRSPGPVIARFEQLQWPFAAMLWDRVLPLDTVDTATILDFYTRYAERTNPEKLCDPSASPSPESPSSGSPSPDPGATGSAAPSVSPGTSPSASPIVPDASPSAFPS